VGFPPQIIVSAWGVIRRTFRVSLAIVHIQCRWSLKRLIELMNYTVGVNLLEPFLCRCVEFRRNFMQVTRHTDHKETIFHRTCPCEQNLEIWIKGENHTVKEWPRLIFRLVWFGPSVCYRTVKKQPKSWGTDLPTVPSAYQAERRSSVYVGVEGYEQATATMQHYDLCSFL
jgi:hypothetical protein